MRDRIASMVLVLLLILPLSMIAMAEKEGSLLVGERSVYDYQVNIEGFILTGEVEFKVTGTAMILGTEVYIVEIKGDGDVSGVTTGTWTMDVRSYYTVNNYAYLQESGYVEMVVEQFGEEYTLKHERTNTYSPPLDLGQFPIEPYETWTATSFKTSELSYYLNDVLDSTETMTEQVEYAMECLGEKTVTVRAGTYTGLEVTYTRDDGRYTVEVYDPGIGVIISEEYTEGGTRTSRMELISYSYEEEEVVPLWIWMLMLIMIVVIAVVIIASTYVARKQRMEEQEQQTYSFLEKKEEPPWR